MWLQKYSKCVKTVEQVIAIKASQNALDLATWEYFKQILKYLSLGGMSSEEEDLKRIGD